MPQCRWVFPALRHWFMRTKQKVCALPRESTAAGREEVLLKLTTQINQAVVLPTAGANKSLSL